MEGAVAAAATAVDAGCVGGGGGDGVVVASEGGGEVEASFVELAGSLEGVMGLSDLLR